MTEKALTTRKFRRNIPESHKKSLDTRIMWLWNQRFGTIQTIYLKADDPLDKLAATLFIQAIIESDLTSINRIFTRLEGGPQLDTALAEGSPIRV